MNYEEKYKQALERARQFSEHPLQEDSACIVEYIFPELAESDGEKIRKALIEMIHDTTGDECEDCYHVSKESVLDWLEKQGEKKNTRKREIDDAYLQGICDTKHEIEKQGEQPTDKVEPKTLNADEVIAWLDKNADLFDAKWCYTKNIIEQLKQDFKL